MSTEPYAGWNRQDLDLQYSPSSCVPSLDHYLAEYRDRSARARREKEVLVDLRYGPHPAELLDYFPAPTTGAPLQIFVHGGNWQALDKDSSAFVAAEFVWAGAAFAAVNYALSPAERLPTIIDMVGRSIRWLAANQPRLGFAADRIHLSGTSAGAHLVAMSAGRLSRTAPDVFRSIAGITLLSGIYDLEPVRHCYVNDTLGLDSAAGARSVSPIWNLPASLPPIVIARGGNETREYVRQHAAMSCALQPRAEVTDISVEHRNHFDLPYDLAVAGTRLGDAVLGQMGLGATG